MVLQLLPASPSDADRIVKIRLEAFADNPLLHAQFPTPASLAALQIILSRETLHAIENAQDTRANLVVKDTELAALSKREALKWLKRKGAAG